MKKQLFVSLIIVGIMLVLAAVWGGSYIMAHVGPDYQFAAITTSMVVGVAGLICLGRAFMSIDI